MFIKQPDMMLKVRKPLVLIFGIYSHNIRKQKLTSLNSDTLDFFYKQLRILSRTQVA